MIRAGHLPAALEGGDADWADVDRSVERVVATRKRFDAVLSQHAPDRSVLACPEHRSLAREAAAKSVVLLRNDPVDGQAVLPIDPDRLSTLALIGGLATAVNLGDGGSSDVWAPEVATVADGVRAALPRAALSVDDGSDLGRAAALAASCALALVVVGYTRDDEGEFIGEFASAHLADLFPGADDPDLVASFEAGIATERLIEPPPHVAARGRSGGFAEGGDRVSLRLHDHDVALIRAVSAANPRTVVSLVAGSAVVIAEWDGAVPAVVQSWYSGMEGGHGLADVLCGRVDASGRLPFSVPARESDLPDFDAGATAFVYDADLGYWHLARQGTPAAYPFGFGLSYTSFSLGDTTATVAGDEVHVDVTVGNSGPRDGTDVVQIYARRLGTDRPARLVGFARVELGPGEVAVVRIPVATSGLAERDVVAHVMAVRPGRYELRVAHHANDPGIVVEVALPGPPA